MSVCKNCKQEKTIEHFYKSDSPKDGVRSWCRACVSAADDAWRSSQRTQRSGPHPTAVWRKKYPEKNRALSKAWRHANPEKAACTAAKYAADNKEKVNKRNAKHRASKLKATPVWADDFIIEEIYDLAQRRTAATGIRWHVDHIVPLRSNLVCGLHAESNLRVITAQENLTKNNRYWPDMPEQRI